jgi:hypothetical protein
MIHYSFKFLNVRKKNASKEDLILRVGFEPTMSYVNDVGNMIKSSFSEKSRSDQDRSNQESKDLHILPKPTSDHYSRTLRPLGHRSCVA